MRERKYLAPITRGRHLTKVIIRYQEDFHSFSALSLNPEELRLSVKKHHGIDWDPDSVGEPYNRQVVFVGIYDGRVFPP